MNARELVGTLQADLCCFDNIHITNDDSVVCACPFHETKSGRPFMIKNGFYFCFNPDCGETGSYDDLAYRMYARAGLRAPSEFRRKYKRAETSKVRQEILDMLYPAPPPEDKTEYYEDHLQDIGPYIKSRGISGMTARYWHLGYSPSNDAVTFPVYDRKGVFKGTVMRRVREKRYALPEGPKPLLFADRETRMSDGPVYICEGPFDALTIMSSGFEYRAVATCGNPSKEQIKDLSTFWCTEFIIATDADAAGNSIARRIYDGIDNKRISRLMLPDGKDVNDLGEKWLDCKREWFTFIPR
jgi:DNA primase